MVPLKRMNILAVVSDPEWQNIIQLCCGVGSPGQPKVTLVHEGRRAMDAFTNRAPNMPFELVLVARSLPDMHGFDLVTKVRAVSNVPIMLLGSTTDDIEKVKGLELGADDYVTLPVTHTEVLARVRAVLRRGSGRQPGQREPSPNGLLINAAAEQVLLHGTAISLTRTEFKLLTLLDDAGGHPVSQKTLLEKIWGEEYLTTPGVLKAHIYRLRRKLGDDPDDPHIIATVGRRGYQLLTGIDGRKRAAELPSVSS